MSTFAARMRVSEGVALRANASVAPPRRAVRCSVSLVLLGEGLAQASDCEWRAAMQLDRPKGGKVRVCQFGALFQL